MNTVDASDRRFVHSRLVDATPEQAFDAFSRPERLVAPLVGPANEQNLDRLQRELAGAGASGARA